MLFAAMATSLGAYLVLKLQITELFGQPNARPLQQLIFIEGKILSWKQYYEEGETMKNKSSVCLDEAWSTMEAFWLGMLKLITFLVNCCSNSSCCLVSSLPSCVRQTELPFCMPRIPVIPYPCIISKLLWNAFLRCLGLIKNGYAGAASVCLLSWCWWELHLWLVMACSYFNLNDLISWSMKLPSIDFSEFFTKLFRLRTTIGVQLIHLVLFLLFSFGNPALDERSILAPLYQCCM